MALVKIRRTIISAGRSTSLIVFSFSPLLASAQQQTISDQEAAAGCAACGGCGGLVVLVIAGLIALNIALLVWVARDSKARSLDNSILWMLLVFFTGFIGLVIYLASRPKGELVKCPVCGNSRLAASRTCPHYGNE